MRFLILILVLSLNACEWIADYPLAESYHSPHADLASQYDSSITNDSISIAIDQQIITHDQNTTDNDSSITTINKITTPPFLTFSTQNYVFSGSLSKSGDIAQWQFSDGAASNSASVTHQFNAAEQPPFKISIASVDQGDGFNEIKIVNQGLNGDISQLIALGTLKKIDLSSNAFSGMLPDFDALNDIEEINLSSNDFSGTIPSFNAFYSLRIVDLSHNRLEKTQTNAFNNLSVIEEIFLNDNQFGATALTDILRDLYINALLYIYNPKVYIKNNPGDGDDTLCSWVDLLRDRGWTIDSACEDDADFY